MKLTEKHNDPHYTKSQDRRPRISLKDKGESRKYVGENPNGLLLTVYQVDGGIFNSTKAGDKKCDFAIYTESDNLYLIELKGGDYSRSLDQLENTLQQLLTIDIETPQSVQARVVLSKTKIPGTLDTKEKKLMALLKKKYHGSLQRKTREMSEILK